MIISRTPFRISFFGGGTDYPVWYREHGGEVLATTIDKYCYLGCRRLPPFFEHRIRVVYSKIENCKTVDEILHPSAREVLRRLGIRENIEIHHDGDLPAGTGVGSSSAFTVGLLHALYELEGKPVSREHLASESIAIEQDVLKETVGSQDQVLAAYGGLNHIQFSQDGRILVRPMNLPEGRTEELKDHLMLFFTGIKRLSSDIAESYVSGFKHKKRELTLMSDLAREAISILNSAEDLGRFGKLLHESWQIKMSLGEQVSTPDIAGLYERALSAGAVGGKLTGAGGGGFLLLFVPPDRQQAVEEKLKGFVRVPFCFEDSGSTIIYSSKTDTKEISNTCFLSSRA